jgi:acetyl esterase/lipase
VLRTAVFVVLVAGFTIGLAGAQTIDLWPGVAPGSEDWTHEERRFDDTPFGPIVQNVVTPTLTPYLPEPDKATGSAVIIAPGGAFVSLVIELQGTDVARWFQERGIAAFVLKYRLLERIDGAPLPSSMDEAGKYGMADGIRALEVLRERAGELGIAPERIGFVGFSAGAMVASAALLQADAATRPAFAALIYGGPFGAMPPIPTELPPMFLAWAQDDAVALTLIERFHDALRSAGHRPEVHVYANGGHGFALKKQGMSSDGWIEQLHVWMGTLGVLAPANRSVHE